MSGKAWVRFIQDKKPSKRKTGVWAVIPERPKVAGDDEYMELGLVKWYAPWRRYCFFPAEGTLFDAACLVEVAEFCRARMAARRIGDQGEDRK